MPKKVTPKKVTPKKVTPKKVTRIPADPFAPTAAQVRVLTDKLLALSIEAGLGTPVKGKTPLSAKGAKVAALINTQSFGCYTDKVTSLVELLLDEKLSEHVETRTGEVKHHPGVCVVLTTKFGGHNYSLGKVLMHTGHTDNRLLTADPDFDNEGNCIPDGLSEMRGPTKAELTEFVKARYFAILKTLKDNNTL